MEGTGAAGQGGEVVLVYLYGSIYCTWFGGPMVGLTFWVSFLFTSFFALYTR